LIHDKEFDTFASDSTSIQLTHMGEFQQILRNGPNNRDICNESEEKHRMSF
jgi:hypothetical protein